jgi:hypothetical protein
MKTANLMIDQAFCVSRFSPRKAVAPLCHIGCTIVRYTKVLTVV